MVIQTSSNHRRAWLTADLVIALAIIFIAFIPLAASINREQRLARIHYQHALITQLLDGEFELLRKGEWQQFKPGVHDYSLTARSLTNLPPGRFILTVQTNLLRLEWSPAKKSGTTFLREVPL
jgi:hypothetical protein